jgi:hypothetical protein
VESKESGRHSKNTNDQNGDFKTHFWKEKILSFHLPGVPDISQYQEKGDRKCCKKQSVLGQKKPNVEPQFFKICK